MAAIATAGCIRLIYFGGYTEFTIKAAHGLDDPELYEMWPPIINTYLDGSMETQFRAFRRNPFIDVGISTREQRMGLLSWMLDNNRTLAYNTGAYYANSLSVVPASSEVKSQWLVDCSHAKKIMFELKESAVRTAWPAES